MDVESHHDAHKEELAAPEECNQRQGVRRTWQALPLSVENVIGYQRQPGHQ